MARMLKGSCLCGQTSYEVEDAFDYAMFCHCSQCRRTTGAACKPMGGIPVGKLRLTAERWADLLVKVHGVPAEEDLFGHADTSVFDKLQKPKKQRDKTARREKWNNR